MKPKKNKTSELMAAFFIELEKEAWGDIDPYWFSETYCHLDEDELENSNEADWECYKNLHKCLKKAMKKVGLI